MAWTVTAEQIIKKGIKHYEIPTKNILYYKFVNSNGDGFRINPLEDGRLDINIDGRLVIHPRASNAIRLEEARF